MESASTIRDLLEAGESRRVVFLPAEADFESLGQSVCALLNSGGGQIVVGVDRTGRPTGKVEVKNIEFVLRPLSGGDANRALLAPNAVWDVSSEQLDEHQLAIVDVPAGRDVPYVFGDTIYIRHDAQTRPASGAETRRLVDHRYMQGGRWERQPVQGVCLGDLDEQEIIKTARVASEKRGWNFSDPGDPEAILHDLNLWQDGRLTNAAVVLFAREAGVILPQAHVRMTAYASDKSGFSLLEDSRTQGHLFKCLNAFDYFVQTHAKVSASFPSSSQVREDRPQYPYWSVREGFRNAMIHRDYSSVHGSVTVSMFASRMEIWSFGSLPEGLTIRELKTADRSLPVNPDIAQVVFLRGLVDLLGRGTRKIVEEFKNNALPDPVWKKQAGGINLVLSAGLLSGDSSQPLGARQVEALRQLKPGQNTDIGSFAGLVKGDWSERSLRNDLAELVRLGFLSKRGRGKATFYVRTEKPIT